MAFAFTRSQILAEADRYLVNASKLPDSDPAKAAYIKAANDLSQVVLARVHDQLALKYYDIPDNA
ncbi:hypothetical protein I5G61_gp33 [Mycobacterium phage Quesadilla]|uniref:Uncharacterized protein n=1 Tax=Mycobacterium phage Quesadilla TaxID=2664226 RepID=A0A5Q2W9S7_9CAUD|nr:hypothetical protein I5G61_gp33 [Mycobacterium phage Quesadilla]QGH75281.1 hypothetical protein SEA_QUESADILLA_33 [Mycobacterium phage Quesadilla]